MIFRYGIGRRAAIGAVRFGAWTFAAVNVLEAWRGSPLGVVSLSSRTAATCAPCQDAVASTLNPVHIRTPRMR